MELKYVLEEGTLRVFFPTRVDTTNAAEVTAALEAVLAKAGAFETLALDLLDTGYVSSVGLRIFLKMRQGHDSFFIDNACVDVYDVLQMTGFTEIMDVRKAMRVISIKGCPVIGEGFYGTVYRINPDTIVKCYFRGNPVSDIERERRLAQKAFILGIPTAISYDVVKIKEGGYGSVFELIDADSFKKRVLEHPENLDRDIAAYCRLLDKIASTEVKGDDLPRSLDAAYTWVKLDAQAFDEATNAKIKALVDSIPDVPFMVHGDCHIMNIFFVGDDPLLIDMDTLSKGHRIFDLSPIFLTYLAYELTEPGNSVKFLGIPFELSEKLFYRTFDGLFPNASKEEKEQIIDKVKFLGFLLLLWRVYTYEPENEARKNLCIDEIKRLSQKLDTLAF